MPEQRLQKILAAAGVASRRAAEEMIRAGKVRVDGRVVRELGVKADPAVHRITVEGRPLPSVEAKEYWLVHKPSRVVSTVRDPEGRRNVMDLLPSGVAGRLYPVGRLDRESEGLVLLTNDGELAHRVMHPSFEVPKYYRVWVTGRVTSRVLNQLRRGVELEDGTMASARVHVKSAGPRRSKLSFVLHEGRKREIRRMCTQVGLTVTRLVRVGMGPLKLGDLPRGEARRLHPGEVSELKAAVGLLSGCKPRADGVQNSAFRQGGRGRGRSRAGARDARRPGRTRL